MHTSSERIWRRMKIRRKDRQMLHIKMKISAGAGRQSNPVLYLFFIVCRWTALRDGLFLSSLVFCPKFLIERFHTGSLKAQIFRVTNLKPNYGVPPFMCVYRGSWRSRQTFEVSVTAELHSTTSSSLKIIIIIILKKKLLLNWICAS